MRSLRDTAGEKREEKFVAAQETRHDWLPNIGIVSASQDADAADAMAQWVDQQISDPSRSLTVADISSAVSEFLLSSGILRARSDWTTGYR